ncbi:MAG: DUF3887 domain-containing protein [Thermoplasmatota archaeon]
MLKQKPFKSILLLTVIISIMISGCTEQKKETQPPEEQLTMEEKARIYVENLSNENYNPLYMNFTEEVTSQFSFEDLQLTWESLISNYGTFEEIIKITKKTEQGYDVIYVTCSFSTLGNLDIRFVFNEQQLIAGFQFVPTQTTETYSSPDYVNQSAFSEENITIGETPWKLPGTLSIPNGSGPYPAIILVHGSGPNDRDETIGPNKPFKDIAQGLAAKGIIVLRYDKRTNVYPEASANLTNLTPQEEVITDALAGITFLQQYSAANISAVFLLGHSLGAMMAPEIARQSNSLQAIIMLAAPARSFEDLYLAQYQYLASLDGIIDETERQQIDAVNQSVQQIKTLNISNNETVLNAPLSYWEYLSTYNPISVTQNLSIPVLILQGERDYQVTYEDDFLIWKQTFQNKSMVSLQSYETLNHLFISGSGPPTNTEYVTPGNVDQEVITDLASWIQNHINED